MRTKIWIILSSLIWLPILLSAQSSLVLNSQSELEVQGTSNIKDWTAVASDMSGSLTVEKGFLKKGPSKNRGILSAEIIIPVGGLDGGRGETMNDKIKKAFDATAHPEIRYRLERTGVWDPADDKTFKLTTQGELAMAGETREVSVAVVYKQLSDGTIEISGSHSLDMEAFGIVPPTAMFGQIEAGKMVSIHFTLVFEPNEKP